MKKCGIYLIEHRESGRKYVGQSIDIEGRIADHSKATGGFMLAAAIRKYGWEAFRTQVLELCQRDALNEREQHWISALGSLEPAGFNLTTGGGQAFTFTEETRRKISERTKAGLTPEVREARAAKLRGRPLTPEHRARIGAAQRNPANIARITALARNMSDEQRAKISASKTGRSTITEDGRRRISEARRSPESLARLAEGRRAITAESRAKMSAAAKDRAARMSRGQDGRFL